MAGRVLLLVGTRKGAFFLESDRSRADWQLRGPFCDVWPIHDVSYQSSAGAILAAGGSPWYGASVWRTDDLGATWTQSSEGLAYPEDQDPIRTVWNVTASNGSLFAGVEPAGLFRSDDSGRTWAHVAGLRDHPSRPDWQPGNGGLCLHSIVPHPSDPARMWVGISAVGTFATEDGGTSWEPRNGGVRADFMPDPAPELGQCVHKLGMHPSRPDTLYQQNHCGVYRSADAGRSWQEVTEGLPSQFGFPLAVHPHDPDSFYVIPLNGDDRGRYMPDGQAAVWRTSDAGTSWTRLSEGLPQEHAYVNVLREAMAVDPLDPAGVYFGTSNGQLYGSADEGASWRILVDDLPAVWSVDAVVLD